MRGLPFFKPKNKPQFAGMNFSNGGGGGGDTSSLANKTDLTAIILTGTTNTSGDTITAGTWFYLNGTPCVAKVDIASGATFTLNTNYEEKTIGSALSELNSNIRGYSGFELSLVSEPSKSFYLSNTYTALLIVSGYNGDTSNRFAIISLHVNYDFTLDVQYIKGDASSSGITISYDSTTHYVTITTSVFMMFGRVITNRIR